MGLTEYLTSPLQTFELGRWVQCQNEECTAYRKTSFRHVRIRQMVDHEVQTWACPVCSTKGVKKVSTSAL